VSLVAAHASIMTAAFVFGGFFGGIEFCAATEKVTFPGRKPFVIRQEEDHFAQVVLCALEQ
jgi:hypothetical protein